MTLKSDGSVWATGYNEYGQLGDGSNADKNQFAQIISDGVVAVAAGEQHSMVLKSDGSVWITGNNHYGQLGDGSRTEKNRFVELTGATSL